MSWVSVISSERTPKVLLPAAKSCPLAVPTVGWRVSAAPSAGDAVIPPSLLVNHYSMSVSPFGLCSSHSFLLGLMLFRILSVTSKRSPHHISLSDIRERDSLGSGLRRAWGWSQGSGPPGFSLHHLPLLVSPSLWGWPHSLLLWGKELGHHHPGLATSVQNSAVFSWNPGQSQGRNLIGLVWVMCPLLDQSQLPGKWYNH